MKSSIFLTRRTNDLLIGTLWHVKSKYIKIITDDIRTFIKFHSKLNKRHTLVLWIFHFSITSRITGLIIKMSVRYQTLQLAGFSQTTGTDWSKLDRSGTLVVFKKWHLLLSDHICNRNVTLYECSSHDHVINFVFYLSNWKKMNKYFVVHTRLKPFQCIF